MRSLLVFSATLFGLTCWAIGHQGALQADEARSSQSGKAVTSSTEMACPIHGTVRQDGSGYCPRCGAALQRMRTQQTSSSSDQQRPSPQQYIGRFDEDENGSLSRQEASRWLTERFDMFDRDANGQINERELEQARMRSSRKSGSPAKTSPVDVVYIWVADLDRGHLKLEDLQSAYRTLRRVDQNDDGRITRAEVQERNEEMLRRWGNEFLDRNDSNEDGQLSRNESSGTAVEQAFERIDRDGNGQITDQELFQTIQNRSSRSGQQQDSESYRTEQTRSGQSESEG